MFYRLLSFIFSNLYPNGSDPKSLVMLGITFLINILVSLVMLPITIRLSGQLIMQVFKYRYIVKHVATVSEDNQVMTGYYQHFKAIMCIILSMVGFNVFNIISAVYFLVYIFKSDWEEELWYRWVVEGLCTAFQECIILFAVSMLYQVACYFRGKKFSFFTISIIILMRFLYVVLTEIIIQQIEKFYTRIMPYSVLELIILIAVMFAIIPMNIYETMIRGPIVFSFVRVTQREVSNYIKKFREDINMAYLDELHFTAKINAGRLFNIAGWGTIGVSILTTMSAFLQFIAVYIIYFLIAQLYLPYEVYLKISPNIALAEAIIIPTLIIIQVITILPSILYIVFLVILWLYFRNKTRVKYSGYNQNDPKILKLIHEENTDNVVHYSNQDAFHYTYYKPKNKIILITYIVIIIIASLLLSGCSIPLFSEKWKETLYLRHGEYYLLKGTELSDKSCPDNLDSIEITSLNQQAINCSEMFVGNFIQPSQVHFQKIIYKTDFLSSIWIPKNSTYIAKEPMQLILRTEKPCYSDQYLQTSSNSFGLNLCNKIAIKNQTQKSADCHHINNNTQVNCSIKYSGMYSIEEYYNPPTLNVSQFSHRISESTQVYLSESRGNNFKDHDVIMFQTRGEVKYPELLCKIKITCNNHPVIRLFMPILILLCALVYLTLSIICIHRI